MPEIEFPTTTTGYEKRITAFVETRGQKIGRSKVQRLAMSLCKRQARMSDLDLEKILGYNDPTPKLAFKNMAAA